MDQQPITLSPFEPIPLVKKRKPVLVIVLAILLIGAIGLSGYLWLQNGNLKKTTVTSTSKTQAASTTTKTTTTDTETSSTAHFVAAVGTPFDLRKHVTATLGLPDLLGAVSTHSDNNNHSLEQYFTDKYNDEIARWEIGYTATPDEQSQISLLAIGKSWLAATSAGNSYNGTSLVTPAEKSAYIAKIRQDTTTCVGSKDTGFKTQGTALNICYTVTTGHDAYDPTLNLTGYTEVDGEPLILLGYIYIVDGKDYPQGTGVNGSPIPQATKDLAQTFIDALSQTNMSVSAGL